MNLDTVKISKTDFIRLALTLPATESFDDNTIAAPKLPQELPLPYFKMLYDFEDQVDVDYFAVYEPPDDDEDVRFTVYVQLSGDNPPIPIMAMGIATAGNGEQELRFSTSPQFEQVARSRLGKAYARKAEADLKWHTDRFCVYGHLYSIVQHLLLNRPELLTKRTERHTSPIPSKSQADKQSAMRRLASYRTITVNREELAKTEAERPPRAYSCLAWGVIGHWRSYKSGKQTWVKPYTKGKERNSPEAYDGKEYVMQEPEIKQDGE